MSSSGWLFHDAKGKTIVWVYAAKYRNEGANEIACQPRVDHTKPIPRTHACSSSSEQDHRGYATRWPTYAVERGPGRTPSSKVLLGDFRRLQKLVSKGFWSSTSLTAAADCSHILEQDAIKSEEVRNVSWTQNRRINTRVLASFFLQSSSKLKTSMTRSSKFESKLVFLNKLLLLFAPYYRTGTCSFF
jgi:hypothetical protein